MSREWKFYIADMITFSQNVLDYTADFNQVKFEANRLVYDATLRNLELIGEAATHIPLDIRSQYSNIAWRKIIALRNRLIHAYLGLDNDILWDVIQTDLRTPKNFFTHNKINHLQNIPLPKINDLQTFSEFSASK